MMETIENMSKRNSLLLDEAIQHYQRIIELIETKNACVDEDLVESCKKNICTLASLRKASALRNLGLEAKIDEVETLCRKIIAAAK